MTRDPGRPIRRIVTIIGARPQFVKAAAVSRAIAAYTPEPPGTAALNEILVHTGQHYDVNMSQVFFDELHIPRPRHNLEVGSGPHGRQTGLMLERIEQILTLERPDWVLVYGDTNSTLAGALAAVKLHIPVAHVEAGLRSFNRRMPEEINRVVADSVADVLFCPTRTAVNNLAREGITRGVHNVGDVMYDSVLYNVALAEQRSVILRTLSLTPRSYLLATVHRAENTDDRRRLQDIFAALGDLDQPVVLPLHPRTRRIIQEQHIAVPPAVRILDPVSYLDMLVLERHTRMLLTDSGGMQKEAYFFGVPCVTLREETEWVELIEAGVNHLAGADRERIRAAAAWAESWTPQPGGTALYGDGRASAAIVRLLANAPRPVATD